MIDNSRITHFIGPVTSNCLHALLALEAVLHSSPRAMLAVSVSGYVAGAGGSEMGDEGAGEVEKLRHVLNVGEHCVFQAVACVSPAAAFAGTEVLREPGKYKDAHLNI